MKNVEIKKADDVSKDMMWSNKTPSQWHWVSRGGFCISLLFFYRFPMLCSSPLQFISCSKKLNYTLQYLFSLLDNVLCSLLFKNLLIFSFFYNFSKRHNTKLLHICDKIKPPKSCLLLTHWCVEFFYYPLSIIYVQ